MKSSFGLLRCAIGFWELMARSGMRVGEVLNLTAMDLDDQKLTIKNPKSGKRAEVVFIPKKVAERLKDYIKTTG